VLVGVLAAGRLMAQGNSSLSESKVENQERNVTAAALLAQNEDLRQQLSVAQESLKTLTTSLAESNAEAELFRRKYSDLELRMEALGLQSADRDRAKLEQRLLAAVGDLQLMQKERDEFRDQMLRLNESIFRYLQTSAGGDAQARMDVETQLRSTNALVTKGDAAPAAQPGLMDGSVISVKEEWSLVVGNIGENQGVKLGMPLRVVRGDHRVATLKVVDVRQRICGAIVQQMDSPKEKIKVGDRLQVDVHSDVSVK
jgi:FtsZ-binding cell division protein ZapB